MAGGNVRWKWTVGPQTVRSETWLTAWNRTVFFRFTKPARNFEMFKMYRPRRSRYFTCLQPLPWPSFFSPLCFITRSPLIISFSPLLRWPYKSWHTHGEIEKILDLHTSAIAEPFWYANRTKKSCYLGLYIWTAEAKKKNKKKKKQFLPPLLLSLPVNYSSTTWIFHLSQASIDLHDSS